MKAHQRLLTWAFLVMIAAPQILWAFIYPGISEENREKRELKKFPVLNALTVKEFPGEFDSYYSDNLPFRYMLINAASSWSYRIYGFTTSKKVLFGKDGWLFYKYREDGDPISDYKRINQFSDGELKRIRANLENTRNYLSSRNVRFILMICPNKENMYPEYMPDYIIRAKRIPRTEQLIEYMDGSGVEILSPMKTLEGLKRDYPVYFKKDTHWNVLGAYAGSCDLARALGKKLPDPRSLNPSVKKAEIPKAATDLLDMSGITLLEENNVDLDWKGNLSKTEITSDVTDFTCPGRKGSLLMLRDSFGITMAPYVSSLFAESEFVHRYSFRNEMIGKRKPDVLVIQIVERYLPELLNYDIINDNVKPMAN